jgi:hypothetical protein
MKALLLLTLLQAQPAGPAQPAATPATRADLHVVAGWQNLHREQPERSSYNDWMNGIFYGGAGAGWYWTDHLKTQIDFGAGTRGQQYRYEQSTVGGNPAYTSSRVSLNQQSLAIGQQFQFFRNAWFHPHVGGGVDLARESTTTEFEATTVYDPVARVTRQITPRHTEGPETKFVARAFVQTGFKAYMTRRAFFTADSRVKFRGNIDEVLFRFGFGVDF